MINDCNIFFLSEWWTINATYGHDFSLDFDSTSWNWFEKSSANVYRRARARDVWPNYVQSGADTGIERASDLRKRSRTNKTARRPWPLIVELIQSTRIMTASRRIKCAVWSHRLIDGVISQWDPSGVTKGALPLNNRTGSLDERLKSSVPPDIPRLMSARCAKNQEYCLFPIPLEKP